MGRSVSTPYNAAAVAYSHIETDIDEDGYEFATDWDWIVDDLREQVRDMFPSARQCDYWVGREDHAVMENAHAFFGLSEYCGLVAYWVVPKDGALADSWCQKAADKFIDRFGTLRRVGVFSNGEAAFERSN